MSLFKQVIGVSYWKMFCTVMVVINLFVWSLRFMGAITSEDYGILPNVQLDNTIVYVDYRFSILGWRSKINA